MPSPAGLTQRVRRPPGPHGRQLPIRTDEHKGAAPTALHPRDHGARDHVAHPQWVAARAGPAGGGAGDRQARRADYRRSPGDAAASGTLLRLATCIEGHVEVVINAVPVFEYGAQTGTWAYEGEGYEVMTGRPPVGDPTLTMTSSLRLGAAGARCYGRIDARQGRERLRLAVVVRRPARRIWRRRRHSSHQPSVTGGTGCPTARSPTIRGACTWSAARSRSRA